MIRSPSPVCAQDEAMDTSACDVMPLPQEIINIYIYSLRDAARGSFWGGEA